MPLRATWWFAVACVLGGCAQEAQAPDGSVAPDAPGTTAPPESEATAPVVLLSSLIPRSATADAGIVFVSARPSAFSSARVVAIRNFRTGQELSSGISRGGWDPVRLEAADGDSIAIRPDAGSAEVHHVKRRTPPRIVRVTPGPGRTDVPLNARLEVVFSAPVTPASTREGVRLRSAAGTPVPVELTLTEGGTLLDIRPSAPLDPESDYVLLVETSVRDVMNMSLERGVSLDFRTSDAVAAGDMTLARTDGAHTDAVVQFGTAYLSASARTGRAWTSQDISWEVSDERVAIVRHDPSLSDSTVSTATLHSQSPGRVTVTARIGSLTERFEVLVYRQTHPASTQFPGARFVGVDVAVDDGRGGRLFRINGDGTGREWLDDGSAWALAPSLRRDGAIVYQRSPPGEPPSLWVRSPSGQHRPVNVAPGRAASCPRFSPDGRHIAFASWNPSGDTSADRDARVATADGSQEWVLPRVRTCPWWSPDGRLLAYMELARSEADRPVVRTIRFDGTDDRPVTQPGATGASRYQVRGWTTDGQIILMDWFGHTWDGPSNYGVHVVTPGLPAVTRLFTSPTYRSPYPTPRDPYVPDGSPWMVGPLDTRSEGGRTLLVSLDGLTRMILPFGGLDVTPVPRTPPDGSGMTAVPHRP